MQRREFIASTAGLAAAVVVGGVPALAGGSPVVLGVGSKLPSLSTADYRRLMDCSTLFFEKPVGKAFQLKGCYFDQDGRFKHVIFGNLTEEQAVRGRLYWRQTQHHAGKKTSHSVLDATEITGGEYSCLECDFAFDPNPRPSPWRWVEVHDPNHNHPRLPDRRIGG